MDLIEKTENCNRHPWELSRSYNLINILKTNNNSFSYADIGSGDKYFTSKIRSITTGKVFAVDSEYTENGIDENEIMCLNDISLLENNSIDCVVMMDVLEHIENEDEFLKIVLTKLKPDGKIVITVPAMQFLFSSHDIFLKHYRRYSRKRLLSVLKKHNIKIEKSHYFYTSLFLLRLISFLLENKKSTKNEAVGIGMWKHKENSLITKILKLSLNIDFKINSILNKTFIHLPGLSLLAVCSKK